MIAISASGLSLAFGTDTVLSDVTFSVNDGERVGVIGVNGAGKTSLFRLLTGAYTPDAGEVFLQKGHTVGMLEQNPDLTSLPGETTVIDYMYTAYPHLLAAEEKIALWEKKLEAAAGAAAETLSLSGELERMHRQFAQEGGLEYRSRCRGMLLRLGFTEELIGQKIRTLSGGQYTRLALARLLATEPDVLLLDEPTNHLDIDALCWLEDFLRGYRKTVLIISHDRYFLDRTTNKTLHIQYTRARLYNGSYSVCKEQQMQEAAATEKRYREQQKVIAKIRANIEFQRRCNQEHNYVTIRSKERQLERMEKVEPVAKAPRDIRMRFSEEEATANDVLQVSRLTFSHSRTPLLRDISFLVRKGERVLFLGPNGSGKSTLMKLINGMLTPTSGKITLGYRIRIGYYDQENRGLCATKTVLQEIHDEYPDKTDLELRSALALFLFVGDDVGKTVGTLSGGERARLTLAKLMLRKCNLLIMDEPTNHLDIGSCEALEDALLAFSGTIVAVSHDRYFINRIATRIIELAPESERGLYDYPLEAYDDAFGEYMRLRQLREERRRATTQSAPPTNARLEYDQKKRENAERRAQERKTERAKARVAELEAELSALEKELFGEAATDYKRAAEIEERRAAAEEELLSLYEMLL